jgi:adenosylmethionine-8-amino-7-oxononanoate aminotransferase
MTGMGRTGRPLACNHWGVAPDIIVLGKGLAAGYCPLGAVVARRNVIDAVRAGSGALVHGFTYNAHSVSTAAGSTVLKLIRKRRLVEAADDSGSGPARHLKSALQRLFELPCVGDIRGKGVMWGVEFVADRPTKTPFSAADNFGARVAENCMARGVLVYPTQGCVDGYQGDHIMIAPPAIITTQEIDDAVTLIQDSIAVSIRRGT